MLSTLGFMLDTSAINWILDLRTEGGNWTLRGPTFITDIQLQEMSRAGEDRRSQLLTVALWHLRATVIRPTGIPSMQDDSDFDFAFRYQQEPLSPISNRLVGRIAMAMGKNVGRNFRDALIAQAALDNDLTLVTADRKLASVARRFGTCVEWIS
jgi:predicted nucleic acid-binding protein